MFKIKTLLLLFLLDTTLFAQSEIVDAITKNDLWERFFSGLNISTDFANGNSDLLYNSTRIQYGYNDAAILSLLNNTVRLPRKTSYLPRIDLKIRPFPFSQLELQYEKSDIDIYTEGASNSILKSFDRESMDDADFYKFRLRIDTHRDTVNILRPELLYYFPQHKALTIIGDKGFYLDIFHKSAAFSSQISTVYDAQDGTSLTEDFIKYKSINSITDLHVISSFKHISALEFNYTKQDLDVTNTDNEFLDDIQLQRFHAGFMISREPDMLHSVNYNILSIDNRSINMFYWEQLRIFNYQERSIIQLKQNSDNLFGKFPGANEFILHQKHFIMIPDGSSSNVTNLSFLGSYGINKNTYLSLGLNYWHPFDNRKTIETFLRYGIGIKNFTHSNAIPDRTVFSDLSDRFLPPWFFRFELHSTNNATTEKDYIRKHEFDFQLGLPFNVNIFFQRDADNYWGSDIVSHNFPHTISLQAFAEYPVDDILFMSNSIKLKTQPLYNMLLSIGFNYYEYIYPGMKALRGHSFWGDSNYTVGFSFFY